MRALGSNEEHRPEAAWWRPCPRCGTFVFLVVTHDGVLRDVGHDGSLGCPAAANGRRGLS